jgi:hypothetical protein
MAAFRIGFDRWVEESNGKDLTEFIRESIDDLRALGPGQPSEAAAV